MSKANTSIVERICEGCGDEIAVKRHSELGWVCQECSDSYKNISDDETQVGELTDEEIDAIVDEENTDEDDNDDLVLDEKELSREGFSFDNDDN